MVFFMRNTKKLCLILFIVCFTGCQNFIDSISGTSTTNFRYAQYLTKAEQIQNITYWSCVESPSTIDQNIAIWKEEFGNEIVDKAFYHYKHKIETNEIPESFTLEDSIGKIKNQRDTNSCSAIAASYFYLLFELSNFFFSRC